LRQHRRTWAVAGSVILLASASTVIWEIVVQPRVPIDWAVARHQLRGAASDVSRALRQSVAIFGVTNNVHLPEWIWRAWIIAVTTLAAWAAMVGQRRARLTLAAVVLAVPLATVALSALVLQQNEVSLQGRHVLPVVVLVPLCSGHVLVRRGRVGPRIVIAAAVGAISVHAVAVWVNASVYAGRTPLTASRTRFDFDFSSLRWPLLVGLAGLWLVATIVAAEFGPRSRHRAQEAISDQAGLAL
jgi:hypothetical protein